MILDTLSVIATLMGIVILIGIGLRLGAFAFDITGAIIEVVCEYLITFFNWCSKKISKQ